MRRQRMTINTWRIPWEGCQSFFRVFTHISPLGWRMLGWKIFVRKNPVCLNMFLWSVLAPQVLQEEGEEEELPTPRSKLNACYVTSRNCWGRCRDAWHTFWRRMRVVWRKNELHLEDAALKGRVNCKVQSGWVSSKSLKVPSKERREGAARQEHRQTHQDHRPLHVHLRRFLRSLLPVSLESW